MDKELSMVCNEVLFYYFYPANPDDQEFNLSLSHNCFQKSEWL